MGNVRLPFFYLCLLVTTLWAAPGISAQDLTSSPVSRQLIPRDLGTNLGMLSYSGSSSDTQIDAVVLRVFSDDVQATEKRADLAYTNGSASFTLNALLPTGLVSYRSELFREVGGILTLVHVADSVVVGDAYLINGQSNAEAGSFVGSAAAFESPWIRSFGTPAYTDISLTGENTQWYVAKGDEAQTPGFIGQWGLVLAKNLVDTYGIPIAILNGGQKGTPESLMSIIEFRRHPLVRTNLGTNYGRLLFRVQEAAIADKVRGLIWYQGESDGSSEANTPPAVYSERFILLRNQWQEDYPNLEKIFLLQVRAGCGDPRAQLRDAQRRLADTADNLVLMSTTAVGGHDGCHYGFNPGYAQIGQRLFRQIAQELYDAPYMTDVNPPNVSQAYYSNSQRTQITVEVRGEDASLSMDNGAEAGFLLANGSANITDGSAAGRSVVLTLGTSGAADETLKYAESRGIWNLWVKNSNGIGLLAFADVRVRPERFASPDILSITSTEAGVEISWTPLSDPHLAGYLIYRGISASSMAIVDTVAITGNGYIDRNVALGETLYYAVAAFEADGTISPLLTPTKIDVTTPVDREPIAFPGRSEGLSLSVYPSPCSESCTVEFSGIAAGATSIRIVDVWGRVVGSLPEVPAVNGTQRHSWNSGETTPGLYFVVAQYTDGSASVPLILNR